MALNTTLTLLRAATRREVDIEGVDAVARHDDTSLDDAINRGLAALYRILTRTRGDQRYLATQTISTVAGTTNYALNTAALSVITVEGVINGDRRWFQSFQPEEYSRLADTNAGWSGEPFRYALRGATDIMFLPAPQAVYSINVFYVPVPTTLTNASDTFDTIARLDDFIVWYAARELATKDKAWDLVGALKAKLDEIRGDIETIARQRDQNSVGRMRDITLQTRAGRRRA